uniref:F-box domain-containing protein n=1 Tax=Panagrolaimus sp. JU765 TaxID=591449 RepID=A0AC34QSP4_9BILA
MADYFNFLGLPSLVQELITNEIVHNSIPEDRIQLALTSKYCNELVQRAKPKKIIDQFWIQDPFAFLANSREYTKTKEELMDILPNCQIKQLVSEYGSVFSSEEYSEILDMLPEAARFATKFNITSTHPIRMGKVVEFYAKLKHLKSIVLKEYDLILPYYPSK